MDALLLEKAETRQSLSLSRKDLEKTKQQAKVKYNTNTVRCVTLVNLLVNTL